MADGNSASRMRLILPLAGCLYIQVLSGHAIAQESLSVPGMFEADGGMSAMDFDAARMSFFSAADRNGDFALSQDEMAQAMAQGGSRLFDGYDGDGNGVISYDEYIQSGNDLFQNLDTDGDGVLASTEM